MVNSPPLFSHCKASPLVSFYCSKCDFEATVDQKSDLTVTCPQCGGALGRKTVREQPFRLSDETTSGSFSSFRNELIDLPQRIGKYRIVSHVASGGFGSVFKGYDGVLDTYVAIKIPRYECLAEEQLSLLIKEARAMAKAEHPHIVPVKEAGRDPNGLPYIIMKWVEGRSLKDLLHAETVSTTMAVELASQIAKAIDFAHQQKLTHRDLKPSNIMIDENNHAMVTDFGLAVSQEFESGEFAGTLPYMSPEQIAADRDVPIDHRSDIWSLGVIFYEMLTGQRPFPNDGIRQHILESSPSELTGFSLPDRVTHACLKCLEKSPDHRFQRANDFVVAVRDSKSTSSNGGLSKVSFVMACLLIAIGIGWKIFSGANPLPPPVIPEVQNVEQGEVVAVVRPQGTKINVRRGLLEITAGESDAYVVMGALDEEHRLLEFDLQQTNWERGAGLIVGYKPGFKELGSAEGGTGLMLKIGVVSDQPKMAWVSRRRVDFGADNAIILGRPFESKEIVRPTADQFKKFRVQFGRGIIDHYIFNRLPPTNVGDLNQLKQKNEQFNGDPDKMTNKEISTTGPFGIYIPQGETVRVKNLLVDQKKFTFRKGE